MKYSDMERMVVKWGLVVLLLFSVASAVFDWLSDGWATPIMLLALVLVIQLVEPVQEIHADVRFLRDINTSAVVKPHDTLKAFYNDLLHAMNRATRTLDLTHIRDQPPADFGGSASNYFDKIVDWLQKDEGRSVRRLISMRTPEMEAWGAELLRASHEHPRLEVRVVDWTVEAPAINMAIVDGEAVFLALTGDSLQRTGGLAVEDDEISKYFSDYYANLWRSATPLDRVLAARAKAV